MTATIMFSERRYDREFGANLAISLKYAVTGS